MPSVYAVRTLARIDFRFFPRHKLTQGESCNEFLLVKKRNLENSAVSVVATGLGRRSWCWRSRQCVPSPQGGGRNETMRRLVLFIQIVLQAPGTGCVAGGFMCLVAPQIPGVWGQLALIGV